MTWNVEQGGGDRLGAILGVVRDARPDVLALQECVGWEDSERLAAVAEAMGVPPEPRHARLVRSNARPSGRRYHLAVVARPAIVRERVRRWGLAHGAAELTLDGGLGVIVTHLVWSDEDARLAELAVLRRLAPPARVSRERLILAGDLNALSPADPYPTDLGARLRAAGVTKYGDPPRFEVIERLRADGWVDPIGGGAWCTARRGEPTVETRTDYVMLSRALTPHAAFIVPACGGSDHDAVCVDVGDGVSGGG